MQFFFSRSLALCNLYTFSVWILLLTFSLHYGFCVLIVPLRDRWYWILFIFQSDIVHQSVYELVHSEDREELQRQLLWNSFLPPDLSGMPLSEALAPDKLHYLERSFTVRFRCLLDNTSGFLVNKIFIFFAKNRFYKCWFPFDSD